MMPSPPSLTKKGKRVSPILASKSAADRGSVSNVDVRSAIAAL
jgi:hypothetical protein